MPSKVNLSDLESQLIDRYNEHVKIILFDRVTPERRQICVAQFMEFLDMVHLLGVDIKMTYKLQEYIPITTKS